MSSRPQTDWPSVRKHLVSFDGSYSGEAEFLEPDRYRSWERGAGPAAISRGAGLSYAAASFVAGGTTVSHRLFNRILDFDSGSNVVELEAGSTLGQVYEFATPRGLFLPVQPGHPSITTGGCVAPDVHGKNQFRDGTMIECVESLRLFHPHHGTLELSRSREPELFRLTCGGYGLTGNILSLRLRLQPIPSSRIRMHVRRAEKIDELATELASAARSSDLVYSWHDFMPGATTDRGFVITGAFEHGSGPPERLRRFRSQLSAEGRARLPFCAFRPITAAVINRVYEAMARRSHASLLPLHEFLFPVHNKELYFLLYGRRGFHETQVLIPGNALAGFVAELRRGVKKHATALTLFSCKLFRGASDLLRFSGDGICVALNFPRTTASEKFAAFVDEVMLACGGRPNLIKDSRVSAAVAARAYPEYELFRERLRAFDRQRLYRSELSERLAL